MLWINTLQTAVIFGKNTRGVIKKGTIIEYIYNAYNYVYKKEHYIDR